MTGIDLLILLAGLVVAGMAKGVTGMGLPLIATPVLAGVFGPRLAVVVITIPILAANSILVLQGWRRVRALRGIWLFVLAGIIGSAIGTHASEARSSDSWVAWFRARLQSRRRWSARTFTRGGSRRRTLW